METAPHAARMGPLPALIDWLERAGVAYSIHEHPVTFTSRDTARAEHVSPQLFAKAVGVVTDDGRRALVVVEAKDHVDLLAARRALRAARVRLMTEAELAEACAGCEVGAVPPVGELFGLPTFVDFALREDADITFQAGTHAHAVRVDRAGWERALNPLYAGLAEDRAVEPAWMRS